MALAATVYLPDEPRQRATERTALGRAATVRLDKRAWDAVVHNFSTTGCLVEVAVDLPVGSSFSVGVSGAGRITARVVWRDGYRYGCSFDHPISEDHVRAAVSADTVVQLPGHTAMDQEHATERWPRPVRFATVVVGAALCWAAVLALF